VRKRGVVVGGGVGGGGVVVHGVAFCGVTSVGVPRSVCIREFNSYQAALGVHAPGTSTPSKLLCVCCV